MVGWARQKPFYAARIAIPASAVIGCVGLYWGVQRIALAL
jgi:hypothetical protein